MPVNKSVVAEYGNNDVMVITKNTDGDFIKNTDVDLIYDKIILGVNPIDYYFGTMGKRKFYGHNTQDRDVYKRQELSLRELLN